jgi:hypothetical protein
VIKYQEFEPAILGDIEKPKSKAKPQKDEELWVVQLADKIDDMFATCLRCTVPKISASLTSALGVDAVLSKPDDMGHLVESINAVFEPH